ncbi:MAG: hypothetical protein HKN41_06755 [Ilumatobacter sp.]|nr:hypothetical protein [Ilumatobacter sp.]
MVGDAIALTAPGAIWPGSGAAVQIADDLPAGATRVAIDDMNASLEIVGSYELGGVQRAFLWSEAAGYTPIPDPDGLVPDADIFEATGLSDDGWIVGIYRAEAGTCGLPSVNPCGFLAVPNGAGYDVSTFQQPPPLAYFGVEDIELATIDGIEQHIAVGFYLAWSDADPTAPWTTLDLGADATFGRAVDVNRVGEIVGTVQSPAPGPVQEGAYWASPTAAPVRLGFLSGDDRSAPSAINDAGTVVGASFAPGFTETRATVWDAPSFTPIELGHVATGVTSSWAQGLSEDGVIVGISDNDAVIWDRAGDYEVGTTIEIDPVPDQSIAAGGFVDLTITATGADIPRFELFAGTPPSTTEPPVSASIDATGRFLWFTAPGDEGLQTFTVSVTDDLDDSVLPATVTFTVEVTEPPPPPVVIYVQEAVVVGDDSRPQAVKEVRLVETIAVVDEVELVLADAPADLEVSVAQPTRVFQTEVGEPVDFLLAVSNLGPAPATSVLTSIAFERPVAVAGLGPDCAYLPDVAEVVCALASLDGTQVFDFRVTFVDGVDQMITVSSVGDQPDPNPGNDSVVLLAQVGLPTANVGASLDVVAGDNELDQILVGTEITIAASALNRGPDPATGVAGAIEFPPDWDVITVPADCAAADDDTISSVVCDLGDLPAPPLPSLPTSSTADVVVVPNSSGLIEFSVGGEQFDPVSNDDVETLFVDARTISADLSVTEAAVSGPRDNGLWDDTGDVAPATPFVRASLATAGASDRVGPTTTFRLMPIDGVVDYEVTQYGGLCTDRSTSTAIVLECEPFSSSSTYRDSPLFRFAPTEPGTYTVRTVIDDDDVFDTDVSNNAIETQIDIVGAPPARLRAIEVNQAVQNWNNEVDLFRGKRTAVRVFVDDPLGPEPSNPSPIEGSGRLVGLDAGGLPLAGSPLLPLNDTVELTDDATQVRAELRASLNFLLPDAWTERDDLTLVFDLTDPTGRELVCAEPDGDPNCRVDVTFTPSTAVELDVIGIGYTTDEVYELDISCANVPCAAPVGLALDGESLPTWQVSVLATDERCNSERGSGTSCHALATTVAASSLIDRSDVSVTGRITPSEDGLSAEASWRIAVVGGDLPDLVVVPIPGGGPPLTVTHRRDGGTVVVPPSQNALVEQVERIRSAFPTDEIRVRFGTLPSFERKPTTYGDVNPVLGQYYLLNWGVDPTSDSGSPDESLFRRVGGFLIGGGERGSGGNAMNQVFSAYLGGSGAPSAGGYARNRGSHELAHSFGKEHATAADHPDRKDRTIGVCGAIASSDAKAHPFTEEIEDLTNGNIEDPPFSPDELWPTIGPLAAGDATKTDDEIWGLDTRRIWSDSNSLSVVDPYETAELMSYCNTGIGQTRWPSAFTYAEIAAGIEASRVGTPDDPGQSDDFVVVVGTVDDAGDVAVEPIVGTNGRRPALPQGDLELRFVDAAGDTLSSAAVQLEQFDGDSITGGAVEGDVPAGFQAVLAAPGTDVAALEFSRDGQMLTRIDASSNAPSVERVAAEVRDGSLLVDWIATDADGEPLDHAVLYSADGGAGWDVLALGVDGRRFSAPAATLTPSTDGLIKVIASDGLLVGEGVSAPFSVANVGPSVEIVTPAVEEGASIGPGVVRLDALAWDAADGVLTGATASWTSSIDGPLGTGSPLDIDTGDLTPGCHRLSVTYFDGDGLPGTATKTVAVASTCSPDDLVGVVLVEKTVADPDVSDAFDFASDIPGHLEFSLSPGASFEIAAPAGQYQLHELPMAGFETESIACDDPSRGSSISVVGASASIDLDAGETIRCRFVNVSVDVDTDRDGLTDDEESLTGTDPNIADTDGDGLEDSIDGSWLLESVEAVPRKTFASPWQKAHMKLIVRTSMIAVRFGLGDVSLRLVGYVEPRVDGCGTAADVDDWITACDSQLVVRQLLALYRRGIETRPLPAPPWHRR